MADQSGTQPFSFNCEGGLVLNRSTFIMQPGQALELTNFEPDIEGGYKRINGCKKIAVHARPGWQPFLKTKGWSVKRYLYTKEIN